MERAALERLWHDLYPGETTVFADLAAYIDRARTVAADLGTDKRANIAPPLDERGAVYCLYPDAFDGGLDGATARMDYFASLGIKTLWVLPVLRSPGRDQGFDISDYRAVDERFGGDAAFDRFLRAARERGLQTVFDIAVNHSSDRHPWFRDAVSRPDSPFRNFYIWSDTDTRYQQAPLVFRGMVDSNWTWSDEAGAYYFHRFYPFQPDLNYAEPRVTAEMVKILIDWKLRGVGGFRMDAIVMLWKREGTDCESLPEVHAILRIFRASLDAVSPGTMLLAEANQRVEGLLPYFGAGDECRGAFHFPLMPRFWQAMAQETPEPLLRASVPPLPERCAWYTFLRVHDEVTLDVIPLEERRALVAAFAGTPERFFRQGEAFAGRLFDLLGGDADRVILAFHLLFSLGGTPVVYYGDEIGMRENRAYYEATAAKTGYPDARFLHRGPFDVDRLARAAADGASPEGRILGAVSELLRLRSAESALFAAMPDLSADGPVLISVRRAAGKKLTFHVNLANATARTDGRLLRPYAAVWRIE